MCHDLNSGHPESELELIIMHPRIHTPQSSQQKLCELKCTQTRTHTHTRTPITLRCFDWPNQMDVRIKNSSFCALAFSWIQWAVRHRRYWLVSSGSCYVSCCVLYFRRFQPFPQIAFNLPMGWHWAYWELYDANGENEVRRETLDGVRRREGWAQAQELTSGEQLLVDNMD